MGSKQTKKATFTWIKIVAIIVVGVSLKLFYDSLSSEGDPFTALLFKVRAPYLDPGYLRKVVPTSFQMVNEEDSVSFDTESERFSVAYTYRYPQVEYYGQVLGRSEINKLIRANFKEIEARAFDELKKDATKHLESKALLPGFGSQPAILRIRADVSYFSKSVLGIRYRIDWSFGGKRQLYRRTQVSGVSVDIALSRELKLRDILGYPYPDFLARLWDRAKADLDERNVDVTTFKLYSDDPEFYLSPVGVVLVNLSSDPNYSNVEVKVPFYENRRLFRSTGPIAHVLNPNTTIETPK